MLSHNKDQWNTIPAHWFKEADILLLKPSNNSTVMVIQVQQTLHIFLPLIENVKG